MRSKKQCLWVIIYISCILYITILSRTKSLNYIVKPIPFWSFIDWFRGNWARGVSIALNVVLFIPLGYLLSGLWKSKRVPVITCLVVTIAIEIVQLITCRGYFDVDDIISNLVGSIVGVFCYHRFSERLKKWPIPVIIVLSGLTGCFIVPTEKTVIYETQFGFYINDVTVNNETLTLSGICEIYSRGFVPYQIQLKSEDKTICAETTNEKTRFKATADITGGENEYEVEVLFQGYQPISTKTYICGNQVQYISDTPKPDIMSTSLAFLLDSGILKIYNVEYDTYVYQVDNRLYWIIGENFDADIIYHLYTEQKENLPEERQQYGFDNRGFRIGNDKELTGTINCGKYRVFSDIIPSEYNVTAIATGMNKGPDIFWKEYFRPDQ